MLDSEFLIYDKRAGGVHVRIALAFAGILLLACLAILPWRTHPLPQAGTFIAVLDTVHFLFYAIIATVLVSLASVLRARALVLLGSGYVFVAIIVVAHALTFPQAFTSTGIPGTRPDSVTWLYFAWHAGLAVAILGYVLLKHRPARVDKLPARTILACLAAAVLLAMVAIWLATEGLPLIAGPMRLRKAAWLGAFLTVLALAAIALSPLWRGRRSILDLALMLSMWAWLLEYVMTPATTRYSAGWYAGRTLGLISGLFVMLMLLIEMSRLYGRTVMLIAVQRRERESRLMLGEAVGAFIAHELRQPLAAIGLNAYTAQKLGAPADSALSGVLNDLIKDSRRANDVIESTRALFGEAEPDKRPTDLNQLVRDTLLMTSPQLRSHRVSVEMELDESLPLVAVNRVQMQQVLMNLFINAAEAMSGVTERPRALTVRSSSGHVGLLIRVDDTGPSIVPDVEDKAFDPFFTTKTHGMGMGLSICRSVVQAHGGTIRMAARKPFGASLEILLPHGGAVVGAD